MTTSEIARRRRKKKEEKEDNYRGGPVRPMTITPKNRKKTSETTFPNAPKRP